MIKNIHRIINNTAFGCPIHLKLTSFFNLGFFHVDFFKMKMFAAAYRLALRMNPRLVLQNPNSWVSSSPGGTQTIPKGRLAAPTEQLGMLAAAPRRSRATARYSIRLTALRSIFEITIRIPGLILEPVRDKRDRAVIRRPRIDIHRTLPAK